jgi:hypothetical protein
VNIGLWDAAGAHCKTMTTVRRTKLEAGVSTRPLISSF